MQNKFKKCQKNKPAAITKDEFKDFLEVNMLIR